MFPYVLALLVTLQTPVPSASQDEIRDGLARAEALYFEAKFVESIQVLARVNDALESRPDRIQDKIATKLQLALANIGLNDTASAKTFLTELFALNPDYVVDGKQYAPKVVALANDAKNEQGRIRCEGAAYEARRNLAAGDAIAVMNLLRTMRPKCPGLADVEPDTAELLYKTGLASYRQNDFSPALQSFRSALKLSPKHELAAQYLDLTENKVQLAGDRLLLQWQKNFDTRSYKAAASDYRQIVSLGDSATPQMLGHVTGEYRKAITPLVDSWKRRCANGDYPAMAQIRSQVSELIPEPSFADDLQAQMKICSVAENSATPKVAPRLDSRTDNVVDGPRQDSSCLVMESQLALARLKTRVDPEIPPATRAYIQNSKVTVKVKIRIDETGSVAVTDVTGSNVILNNAVRTAMERWKFSPIADRDGPRCVNTEIPFVISK